MAVATTPDAAANPKKQQRSGKVRVIRAMKGDFYVLMLVTFAHWICSDKAPSGNVKKLRSCPPAKQTNTLDMWFKKTASKATPPAAAAAESGDTPSEKASANDSAGSNSDSLPTEPVVELTSVTPPVQKKKLIGATSSSSKKLVQRRIHINDPCRVCESARTDETSRCELRCLGCDMTVHKRCYDVESEDPIDDWNCRRCQYILGKKEELKSAEEDSVLTTETDSSLLPTHERLGETHKQHELHGNSDFATIFQFLKRFRRMGLKVSTDVTLTNLAEALTLSAPSDEFLGELHLRLLVNVEATVNKNRDWTVNLARFLASAEHHPSSATLDVFIASAAPSKKEQSVVDTTAELYAALSTPERVAVLKYLCEAQFDDNEALVERIGDQGGDSLRDEPVGIDSAGRTYWALEDAPSVLDGTVWVCRCADANQQQEEDGGSSDSPAQWETVSDNLETLESLIEWLSLSSESADLQLWQQFSSGILKSLVRRNKKQQQSAARLARMPRMLGGASGFDLGAIVGDDDDRFGVRRSTRSRRAVSYLVESEEEEEEEEANASNGSEEDDNEENNDEERPSKRPRRSAQQQQQRKPKRVEPEPSRRSSRLRGGDGDHASSRTQSSSHAAASSSPRRRSDRRVAAEAAASGALSSSRRRSLCSQQPSSRDSDDKDSSNSDSSDSEDDEEEVEEEDA